MPALAGQVYPATLDLRRRDIDGPRPAPGTRRKSTTTPRPSPRRRSRRSPGSTGSASTPAPPPTTTTSDAVAMRSLTQAGPRAVAMAAMPSPRPVRPSPSVVVADRDTGAPDSACAEHGDGLGPARPDLGPVPDHVDGDVADDVPGLGDQPRGLAQQRHPGRARPLGPRRTEVRAEVAEPGRGKERVAGRVGGRVPVGMPGQAGLARPFKPRQDTGSARLRRDAHPPRAPLAATSPPRADYLAPAGYETTRAGEITAQAGPGTRLN